MKTQTNIQYDPLTKKYTDAVGIISGMGGISGIYDSEGYEVTLDSDGAYWRMPNGRKAEPYNGIMIPIANSQSE